MRFGFGRPVFGLHVWFLSLVILACSHLGIAYAKSSGAAATTKAAPAKTAPSAAKSLSVTIRQVNPDGTAQHVKCSEHKKCVLPIAIQTGAKKQTLTVHILFVSGNVLFEFETPKGYLYAGPKTPADKTADYETIWHKTPVQLKSPVVDVTLFQPLVPRATGAPFLKTPQQAVADLEITTGETP